MHLSSSALLCGCGPVHDAHAVRASTSPCRRRKGISGARKDEDEGATGDSGPSLSKGFQSMPSLLPSHAEVPESPISMAGMASALKAAAANRKDDDEEDDGDWSSD